MILTTATDSDTLPLPWWVKEWRADNKALELGTGYLRFDTIFGIGGLAKLRAGVLDVLAVHTFTPGRGCFRRFMRAAKRAFQVIEVWEVWSDELEIMLRRYGFLPAERVEPDGEQLTGLVWRKEGAV